MKFSLASSVVSMTTAASMAETVDDAPLLQKDISSDTAPLASAVGDTSSLLTGMHHYPNASTHVREFLPRSNDTTAALVRSDLLLNTEDSRTITTIGSGSGDGVTGSVDIDVGLLPISERLLDSVQEDCAATCNNWNRPVIEEDGESFRELLMSCTAGNCPSYLDYGDVPIGCWDTSDVTDMSYAFEATNRFDKAINCWNTAHVTDMRYMFLGAFSFNQPVNDWNVESVTGMDGMFLSANYFNQSLDDWNVARVNDMTYMFGFAYNFNQPLDDWDVASVTDMGFMFYYAISFNQPLDDWNVANVTSMFGMIAGQYYNPNPFNQCLSTWSDKTPPDVNVGYIFFNSDCPNKYPDPSVGPWCQGEDEQCLAPSDAITDPPTSAPSASPTSAPSASPTSVPSASPTSAPSTPPTVGPIALPTAGPIALPTAGPIALPTAGPIVKQKKTSKKSKK